jgi:hypothetical protein
MNHIDRKTLIALGLIALAGVPIFLLLKDVKAPQRDVSPLSSVPHGAQLPNATLSANGTSVAALQSHLTPKAADKPEELATSDMGPPEPSLVLDVYAPAKVRAAMQNNAWLQQTLKQPLGEGFIGSWAGFLGTRGEDVAASFKGQVVDYLSTELLTVPFRVVWFGGDQSTSTPVVVVPTLPSGAQAAFAQLTQIAGHGVQVADGCPEPAIRTDGGIGSVTKGVDGGALVKAKDPSKQLQIQRWVLANQAIYASMANGTLVLARTPKAVVQGRCMKATGTVPTPGADVELTLATPGLGHEAQVLTALLGVGPQPRLAFAIEENRLVPRGIAAELARPGRVDTAPLSEELLKTIPADMPVLFTAQLKLPQQLEPATLKSYFAGADTPSPLTRQAAVVWLPHGDPQTTEVALIWSRPQDKAALEAAFAGGPNPMRHATICNQLVFASTDALLQRLQRACAGSTPSMVNAAAPVLAGLRAPQSVGLQLQLGTLLSGITLESFTSETRQGPAKGAPPPAELREAQQQLEQLPVFGFTGTAQGTALIAGGFHS